MSAQHYELVTKRTKLGRLVDTKGAGKVSRTGCGTERHRPVPGVKLRTVRLALASAARRRTILQALIYQELQD